MNMMVYLFWILCNSVSLILGSFSSFVTIVVIIYYISSLLCLRYSLLSFSMIVGNVIDVYLIALFSLFLCVA